MRLFATGVSIWVIVSILAPGRDCALVSPGVGDECGSGQAFPVRFGNSMFIGCAEFGGSKWCTLEDQTTVVCPDLPIQSPTVDNLGLITPERRLVSSPGPKVVISELMVVNDNEDWVDDDGEMADWIELHNGGQEPVDLGGWTLTDDEDELAKWQLPAIVIEPDQYILIVASGKDKVTETAAHTNFKLKSRGEYVALVRPDGSIASATQHEFPQQFANIAYGLPNYGGGGEYGITDPFYNFLDKATPGEANSGVRKSGPFIASVQHSYEGEMLPVGVDITVTAVVSEHLATIQGVSLTYRIMYGEEETIPMQNSGQEGDPVYSAVIPTGNAKAGEMVRWFVSTVDVKDRTDRSPMFPTKFWPEYYGTVISHPKLESKTIPTLYWFTEDLEKAISEDKKGARSSVMYNGKFYDNIFTRRRGITALTWPKPKIKFDFKGDVFELTEDHKVEEFNLQSFWEEPGEDTYMREPVAFQVMRESGVPACESFHVRVNQNGGYYGLFAFVEQVDDTFLERRDMDPAGVLFKSSHGEFSNLRWDIKPVDINWAYRKGNRMGVDDTEILYGLIRGLGGGGEVARSKFIFDKLNIPEVINYMAVNNMLLNQDRCTKNFYTYRDPKTLRWSIFPWDMEASLGISNGLGGKPSPDYCILACEQWNSPLYCDSDHPQDLMELIGMTIQTGRRLKLAPREITPQQLEYSIPSEKKYDEDRTTKPSPAGPPGTYNHLDDAILDWPVTREMYLRRLRSLIDQFHNGRLEEIVLEMWESIESEAELDNEEWGLTRNVKYGVRQLVIEQIPKRKEQLLEFYGPGGMGLIPKSQPSKPRISISKVASDYVRISNKSKYAVDVSGWMLGGDVTFKFQPGTVIPSKGRVYVTPDILAFLNRKKSPKGGQGRFVVGPSTEIAGDSITLISKQGQTIA